MEGNRRGRKRKGNSRPVITYGGQPSGFPPTYHQPRPSFLSGFLSTMILMSLMSLIYLMLEYHCTTCSAKCDINNISKNIDDIAKNLSIIKQSYRDLEIQMSKFTLEIPKIEGQIDILEALANTLENTEFAWNPRTHLTLPNVDVYLTKPIDGKNASSKSSKHMYNYTNKNSTIKSL